MPCEGTQEVCTVAAGRMGADMAEVGGGICWGWALPRDPSWGGWDMPRGPWGGSRWGHASGRPLGQAPSLGQTQHCLCLCLCLAGDCPSRGVGGAHGALGRAAKAEGAMVRRDWGDTQCQGVHGPWHTEQRRGLRAPPRLLRAPTSSTQPRNGPNWGSCSPALCFGAAAEGGEGCQSLLLLSAAFGITGSCSPTPVPWHSSPSLATEGDSLLAHRFRPRSHEAGRGHPLQMFPGGADVGPWVHVGMGAAPRQGPQASLPLPRHFICAA